MVKNYIIVKNYDKKSCTVAIKRLYICRTLNNYIIKMELKYRWNCEKKDLCKLHRRAAVELETEIIKIHQI